MCDRLTTSVRNIKKDYCNDLSDGLFDYNIPNFWDMSYPVCSVLDCFTK